MDPELLKVILGGGGGAGVALAILSWLRDRRKDRLMDEETALSRLKDDYDRLERSGAKGWALAAWYRHHYTLARDRLPSEDRADFPPGPPADLEI